jgi:hypothetical protein
MLQLPGWCFCELSLKVGGADFADSCAKVDTASLDTDPLLQDPLVELAYDESDEDDQLDFRALKQACVERKMRDRVNSWRAAHNLPSHAKKQARIAVPHAGHPRKRQRRVVGANAALPIEDGLLDAAGGVGNEGAPDAIPALGPRLAPLADGHVAGASDQEALEEDAVAVAGRPARAPRGVLLVWESVDCSRCGALHIGEYKYGHAPGGHAPVWMMQVKLEDGTRPSMGTSVFSTRRTSVGGETSEYALRWIQERCACCAD